MSIGIVGLGYVGLPLAVISVLGWEPRVGLDEGLASTLEWARESRASGRDELLQRGVRVPGGVGAPGANRVHERALESEARQQRALWRPRANALWRAERQRATSERLGAPRERSHPCADAITCARSPTGAGRFLDD